MNTIRLWLRQCAWWVLGTVKPSENEIDVAMRAAYVDAGLSLDHYYPEYDLRAAQKLHEVLIHAASRLGNPLRTVTDVKELLS